MNYWTLPNPAGHSFEKWFWKKAVSPDCNWNNLFLFHWLFADACQFSKSSVLSESNAASAGQLCSHRHWDIVWNPNWSGLFPGEGIIVAISEVLKKEFVKVKPFVDTSMVIAAAVLSFVFLGYLAGVREGTIISALIIGPIVRVLKKYLDSYVGRLIDKWYNWVI